MTSSRQESSRSLVGVTHHYGYPLWALVKRDLKKRYAVTVLGLGWTLIQPVVLLLLYVLVFGVFMKVNTPEGPAEFIFRLLAGMLPYLAISDGLQRSASSLREDRGLLDRVVFPAEVVPAARILSAAVAQGVGMLVLTALVIAFRGASPWMFALPIVMVLQLVMTIGLSLCVSVLAVFITDFTEILSLMLTAWLFVTPVFYAPEVVPSGFRFLLYLNPLHALVSSYRHIMLDGNSPFPDAALLVGWTVAFSWLGWWFFRKTLDRAKDFL